MDVTLQKLIFTKTTALYTGSNRNLELPVFIPKHGVKNFCVEKTAREYTICKNLV